MKSNKKKSPRVRILEVAARLFHKNGYSETGINLILKESKCAKASLYEHFSSKENLALSVLRRYEAGTIIWMQKIIRDSDTPTEFSSNLLKAILLQMKSKHEINRGCPIALFSVHFSNEKKLENQFKKISVKWEKLIVDKIELWKKRKLIKESYDSKFLAKFILNLYEGSIVMWRMSKDEEYLLQIKNQINLVFKK